MQPDVSHLHVHGCMHGGRDSSSIRFAETCFSNIYACSLVRSQADPSPIECYRSTPRPCIDCIWAWLEFAQTSEFLSDHIKVFS